MKDYRIYMDEPASEWELGTPIGNGRMGAMIYGGIGQERIQFTEENIWAGETKNTDDPTFRDVIENIRKLLLAGSAAEADEYATKALDGKFHTIRSQETACELFLDFDTEDRITDYRRDLLLNRAVACVSFNADGKKQIREYFASYPDNVIAVRISNTGGTSFRAHLERFDKSKPDGSHMLNVRSLKAENDCLRMTAVTTCGKHEFQVIVKFINDGGSLEIMGDTVCVCNANNCLILVSIAAGKEACLPEISDWDTLYRRHTEDFRTIMERSEIDLGGRPEMDAVSMPHRLTRMKNGAEDPGVVETYFQFGKYLLISSSRPGTLPAHLQGVWNDYIYAPWNADYHTNINLQMNYWPAEIANISECEEPLNDYINDYLLEAGKRVASVNYRCRGAVLHHLSDIYGFAAPADGLWGLWPMGGAWLCYNLWEHYLYGEDKQYFEQHGYEYMKQCTRFFLDYMFEDGQGRLLSGPSTSPENKYYCNGKTAYLCLSPSMDTEIISGLLERFIAASELLGKDADQAEEAHSALSKMPKLKVGKHGQLMEWMEDYDEPEPGHRHISHMFGVYPGNSITEESPALFKAAGQTIKRRLSFGGGHTGWSAAWLISLHARLKDSEGTHAMIRKLLTKSTRDSMLDFHPPFQIDGNFGGAAGIAEMLLQSHEGCISLLPALPKEYESGSFTGLRARGNVTVSCRWEKGKVVSFVLSAPAGRSYRVRFDGRELNAAIGAGGRYEYVV